MTSFLYFFEDQYSVCLQISGPEDIKRNLFFLRSNVPHRSGSFLNPLSRSDPTMAKDIFMYCGGVATSVLKIANAQSSHRIGERICQVGYKLRKGLHLLPCYAPSRDAWPG